MKGFSREREIRQAYWRKEHQKIVSKKFPLKKIEKINKNRKLIVADVFPEALFSVALLVREDVCPVLVDD